MPSGHPLPKGNESCQIFTKQTDDLFLECIIEMNKREAQVLAPVFIIVASVTSGTTFTKELGHLNSNLGEHVHQLGHHITITLGIDKAGGLAQIPHPASSSDTVDIFVHIIRHVVVDDMRHVGNIQSSSSNCSSHQYRLVPSSEVEQRLLPGFP